MNLTTNLGASMITGIFDTDPSSPTAIKKRAPFELRVGPFVNYELEVLSFRGRERANDAYRYEVTFATEVDEDTLHASIFGAPGCLTIKAPGYDPRVIQGLVASIEGLGGVPSEQGTPRRRYRLTIVPKLWLMKHRRKNRVFQQKSAVDIATLMLADIGMAKAEIRWRVVDTAYPKLPFVYQRNESDFDFFRRVLADAGIFFYFDHSSALLDALLPTAGSASGSAAASASVSLGFGGVSVSASAGASASGPAATGGTTVLNFAARASDTLAVLSATGGSSAAPAPAASASIGVGGMGVSVSVGLGGVSASVSAGGGTDASASAPSATITFDDGMGADPDDDRVYEFGLKKQLRTKALRLHERLVDTAANWVGEQVVVPPPPPSSPPSAPSVSASASLGGLSASVSVPAVSVSVGLGGVSASVGAAPAAAGSVPFDLETTLVTPDVLRQERYQVDPGLSLGQTPGSINNPRMDLELARTRRRYLEAEGKSDCRRMGAGYRFTLADHPIQALNGEYTVVELDAEGTHPDYATEVDHVYRNRFRCIPSTYAPLPPRPKKRPKLGIEMARVVAYSDILKVPYLESSPNGYVKVRFQWDIVDKNGASTGMLQNGVKYTSGTEDNFAIWVPVMQPWAGAGYGTQFVPREGMDVIVGFLEDQGERPVILGCLYSAVNPPPWADQPGSQKVGIKSQTRAANGGYSELSIDDTQGSEVVAITAQTDLVENVLQDRTTTIGNNRSTTITADDTTTVGNDRSVTVTADNTETIGGDATLSVAGVLTQSVASTRTETTGGDLLTTVQGQRNHTVSGSASLTVQGDLVDSVQGSRTTHVDGTVSTVIGTEDAVGGYSDFYVYGDYTIGASGNIRIKALNSIVLQCGNTVFTLTPSSLAAVAKAIAMVGQDRMFLSGPGPTITLTTEAEIAAKTINLYSSGSSLVLDANVTAQGASVKLGSGAPPAQSPTSSSIVQPMKSFMMTPKDAKQQPYPNKQYKLLVDGVVTSGVTGGDGSITAQIAATAVLAHLTVWTGDYPEGARVRWDLSLIDKHEAPNSVQGAMSRLTNLGYYSGPVTAELTPAGTAALQQFQQAQGLPLTGAIDDATVAALATAHGH